MADKKHIDEISGVETTGHEWDGIRELNNPMPRWWVYTFYATIVWAIGYTIMYPAWPLLTDNTKGLLGYSSRAEVAQELTAAKSAQSVYLEKIAALPLDQIVASWKPFLGARKAFRITDAGVAELTESCGLTQAEAELMSKLHQARKKP